MKTKMRLFLFSVFSVLILSACAAPNTEPIPVTQTQPTDSNLSAAAEVDPAQTPTASAGFQPNQSPSDYRGLALPLKKNAWFAGSGLCTSCHTAMVDNAGADVSTDRLWRGSLMANSARDPYWQASVRSEVFRAPELQAVIEDKCATCHIPLIATSAHMDDGQAALLEDGYLDSQNPSHPLAIDGVSCTLCHQIEPTHFGQPESFSGHYQIDPDLPEGERHAYGPFDPPPGQANIMSSSSGFIPLKADHIQQSELCASCHMLYTPYLDESGAIAGEFPEQTPYLEWLNSSFAQGAACNDCHMPAVRGEVRLSITGGPVRSPVLQHSFLGGNVTMATIMLKNAEGLGTAASAQDFQTTIALTQEHLQKRTATVEIKNAQLDGGKLTGDILVTVLTGHKFPTSFPSRRAWLEIVVLDANEQPLFSSGMINPDGSIKENDNDLDPLTFEPHYQVISSADQVQIYEPIMGDTQDRVTTTLMRGSQYLKDNRLLPNGFDKAAADPDIAVHGQAADDPDFIAGRDTVQLDIDLGAVQGPLTLKVTLNYQSIGFRWAQNLAQAQGLEIDLFLSLMDAYDNAPVLVSADQTIIK